MTLHGYQFSLQLMTSNIFTINIFILKAKQNTYFLLDLENFIILFQRTFYWNYFIYRNEILLIFILLYKIFLTNIA